MLDRYNRPGQFGLSGRRTHELSPFPCTSDSGRGCGRLAHCGRGGRGTVQVQRNGGPASGCTPDGVGRPRPQGTWTSSGATPMERPDDAQGRETLTDEEVARIRSEIAARNEQLLQAEARRTVAGSNVGTYNNFWWDRGARTNRTSMFVDPPDGRAGRQEQPTPRRRLVGRPPHLGAMRHARWDAECDVSSKLQQYIQVFQAPGYVALLLEQVHEARIIPLDERPPLRSSIGQWNGDSRGHWEGDSLVVVTRNLDHRVSAPSAVVDLQLAQRLR